MPESVHRCNGDEAFSWPDKCNCSNEGVATYPMLHRPRGERVVLHYGCYLFSSCGEVWDFWAENGTEKLIDGIREYEASGPLSEISDDIMCLATTRFTRHVKFWGNARLSGSGNSTSASSSLFICAIWNQNTIQLRLIKMVIRVV